MNTANLFGRVACVAILCIATQASANILVTVEDEGGIVDFGQAIFELPSTQTRDIQLVNTTAGDIDAAITISGGAADDFEMTIDGTTQDSGDPLIVPNLGSVTVRVTFTPSERGMRSATASIAGTGAPFLLTFQGECPVIFINNTALRSFGTKSVTAGDSSILTISIKNNGTEDITLTGTFAPSIASHYSISSFVPSNVVTAGSVTTATVVFAPVENGEHSGDLTFSSSPAYPEQSVPVTGTGTAPKISVDFTGFSLVNTRVGDSSQTSFEITNIGAEDLDVSSITAPPGFSVSPTSQILAPTVSATIGVTFAPTEHITYSGNLEIVSDSYLAGEGLITQAISASGETPVLSVVDSLGIALESLDFGDVTLGATPTKEVVIENNGDSVMNVLSITAGGDFSTDLGSTTVSAGESVTVTVTFSPSASGDAAGNLTITTDNPVGDSSETITLSAFGTSSQLATDEDSLSFLDVPVNVDSDTETVVISNSGTSVLTITEISIDTEPNLNTAGTASPHFHLTVPESIPKTLLSARETTSTSEILSVSVKCKPLASGTQTAFLTIRTNATSGAQIKSVSLICFGIQAIPSVPASHSFGSLAVGSTDTKDVTISNSGNAPLIVSSATGTTGTPFSITGLSTSLTIPKTESRTITVVYAPTSTGDHSTTINLISDAPDSPTSFTVSGTGVEGNLVVVDSVGTLATSWNFNDVSTAESSTANLQVENTGALDTEIDNIEISGDVAAFELPVVVSGIGVAAGAKVPLVLTCSPDITGSREATLTITFKPNPTLPAVQTKTIDLFCNGTAGNIVITPGSYDFGTVPIGLSEPVTKTFTIENQGDASVTVQSVSVTNSVYQLENLDTIPATLEKNQAVNVKVTFNPSNDGITVNDNLVVTLAGLSAEQAAITGIGVSDNDCVVVSATAEAGGSVDYDLGTWPVGEEGTPTTFTIQNGCEVAFQVLSVSLSNITDFEKDLVVPTMLNPGSGGMGDTLTFDVTPRPQTGEEITATLTILTDLSVASSETTKTVGTKGGDRDVTPDKVTVDFGDHDINEATPSTETVSITVVNQVETALQMNVSIVEDPLGYFAITSETSLQIDPHTSSPKTVEISFNPTAVTVTEYSAKLRIDYGDEPSLVTLNGRGVDRSIVVTPTNLSFGDVQRNTGSKSIEVTIMNNLADEIVVTVGSPTSDGDGASAFSVDWEDSEKSIEGGGSVSLNVTFDPKTAKQFGRFDPSLNPESEHKVIHIPISTSNLDGEAERLNLFGKGVVPTLEMSVPDFGRDVGLGLPATADVVILNKDDQNAVEVTAIQVVDSEGNELTGGEFRIEGFESQSIAANASLTATVVFTPKESGLRSAKLVLYVKGDPDPIQEVTVQGTAISLHARGGGCSSGGHAPWWLMGLFFVLLYWRRNRKMISVLGFTVVALLIPEGASAQDMRNIDVNTFRPSLGIETEAFTVDTPIVGDKGDWSLGLSVNYATEILNVDIEMLDVSEQPISERSTAELSLAYGLFDRVEFGVQLPLIDQSGSASPISGIDPVSGFSIGDALLRVKTLLTKGKRLSLGTSVEFTFPTASEGAFAGGSSFSGHARASVQYMTKRLRLAMNSGVRLRDSQDFLDAVQGHEITFGLASVIRVQNRVALITELVGAKGLSGGNSSSSMPLEALAGVRLRMNRKIGLAFGVGTVVAQGIGAPGMRGFVQLSFSPGASKIVPLYVKPKPPPLDKGDDDKDGILNYQDKCPLESEDKDKFEDEDGCPEPDNDKDGLLDELDKCPNEAEDADGYQDEDGCIDPDNDGDKVPDVKDKCPNEKEDMDGYRDQDGCLDDDNDGDFIPDELDGCQLEAENYNGVDDEDGCPDEGFVEIPHKDSGVIATKKLVSFVRKKSKLTREGKEILRQMSALLHAHKEILLIRIVVKVAGEPGRRSLQLSRRRANVIKAELDKQKVKTKVEAVGRGAGEKDSVTFHIADRK